MAAIRTGGPALTAAEGATPGARAGAPPLAWYALGVLTLVILFAGVDRQVLVVLGEAVRVSLGMNDLQLGLLQGPPVAILIVLATYPLAWLADRVDRRMVLAGSIVIWSVAVILCGFARSYPALFVAAALVGIGEAAVGPTTLAAIPDLFPRRSWQLANSIYSMATSAGSALTFAICGQLSVLAASIGPGLPAPLAALESWRVTFLLAAVPAPLMVLLLATLPRLHAPAFTPAMPAAPVGDPAQFGPFLKRHRGAIARLFGSFALSNLGYAALMGWIVVLCIRDYGQTAAQVGSGITLASLASLPLSFLISLALSRRYAERVGPAFPIVVLATTLIASAALIATLLFATTALQIYLVIFFGFLLNTTGAMLLPTALQTLVPAGARARLIGINIIVTGLVAPLAAPLVGYLSDRFGKEHGSLLHAILIICVPSLLAGGVLLWSSRRSFERASAAARDLEAASGQPTAG